MVNTMNSCATTGHTYAFAAPRHSAELTVNPRLPANSVMGSVFLHLPHWRLSSGSPGVSGGYLPPPRGGGGDGGGIPPGATVAIVINLASDGQ